MKFLKVLRFWKTWETVFHDTQGDISRYDYDGMLPMVPPRVIDKAIHFGLHSVAKLERAEDGTEVHIPIQSFLRLKAPRYQDVDITVRVEIPHAAKTLDDGLTENNSYWFGVAVRALEMYMWSSYLFYIRKDGRVEFGIHGVHESHPIVKSPQPEVAMEPVILRIKAEKDHIQTWINDIPKHDEWDADRRFVRPGDIYLLSYGVLAKIYEVEVKAKKWDSLLIRFFKKTWKIFVTLLAVAAGLITVYQFVIKPR